MIKNLFKSVGACIVGILVGVILSIGTDQILEGNGILPHGNLWVSASLIVFVLAYRTVYNILGSYIVARLAPHHPMKHAIIVGVLGTIVSAIGAVAASSMDLGPGWYAWTLAALSLPSSWLGGWLYVRRARAAANPSL